MRVVVLGAGVVGVAAAWYLRAAGHEVRVVERGHAVAQETSHANGGQISVSHAEPWANPGAFMKLLKWLGREDAPLLWRMRADPAQWAWGLRFLAQCRPGRVRANTAALVRLGLYSRACLRQLRQQLKLEYDHLERGILHVYTDPRDFDKAIVQSGLMRALGCDRNPQTAAQCLEIEPALRASAVSIVGGTYTPSDESGDACRFTEALAGHCAAQGVEFHFGTGVNGLQAAGDRIAAIRLSNGKELSADAYVMALGSYSPLLLRPLGVHIPVYPAKGYSVTIPLSDSDRAPFVSLTDEAHKLVMTRLGQRLRVAGTAEFTGYDTSLNARRCRAIVDRTFLLFPDIGARTEAQCWAGLRPATPGNVPLIGRTRYRNLLLDTGHGTLGWTLACGSGKLLADLVSGADPAVDPAPYLPESASPQ